MYQVKKVLITGISGFAGSHLAQHLLSKDDYSVCGTYLSVASLANVESIRSKVELERMDLLEKENISDYIKSIAPDSIFHLAALPLAADSFTYPTETIMNNVVAQINLLEAVKDAKLMKTRVLIVSSADVYGNVDKKDLPIDEDTDMMPVNPYAVSKLTQDFLGLMYFLAYKIAIIRVRPFNHIGSRQAPNFVVSSFAKRIAEIEKTGKEGVLSVGDLSTKRDFTDVRDMVVAYRLAIEKGKIGDVYNIGSGTSYKIETILTDLLSLSHANIKVERDSKLLRPSDTQDRVCDNRKFTELTDWKPTITLKKTLADTLDYWRELV